MNNESDMVASILVTLVPMWVVSVLMVGWFWGAELRMEWGVWKRMGLMTLGVIAGGAAMLYWGPRMQVNMDDFWRVETLLAIGVTPVIVMAVGVKLYEKWVNGRMSEAEKRGGGAGFRAWMTKWNIAAAIVLGWCLSPWWGMSVMVGMVMALGLFLAYPVVVLAGGEATERRSDEATEGRRGEGLGADRERVLAMLEQGKVTGEEAAELLNALGATVVKREVRTPWKMGRKLMVIGAGVVLVGFMLPWFEVNMGKEMGKMMGQMQGAMGVGGTMLQGMMPSGQGMEGAMPTVVVRGGDIGKGLGWIVLGLAGLAAMVPMMAGSMEKEMRKMVTAGCLGVGGVILLYLMSSAFSAVQVGIVGAAVGYVVMGVGAVKEYEVFGEEGRVVVAAY